MCDDEDYKEYSTGHWLDRVVGVAFGIVLLVVLAELYGVPDKVLALVGQI